MIERRASDRGDRKPGENVQQFAVGNRISVPGLASGTQFTERRYGTVVESYEGMMTPYGRQRFYAVRWDDAKDVVDRGHIGIRFRLEP